MSIEINILHNFDAIENFYSDLVQDVAGAAVRGSINKALRTGRKESLKEIHKRISINTRVKTKTDFGKENVKIFKARGSNAFNMEGSLGFSSNAIPMLNFVRGNTDNIKQKGIKISKRKKLKVQIFKGKKFTLKKAFIQKHHSKQVFKGKGKGQGKGLIKQGIPSVSHLAENSKIETNIRKLLQKRFNTELKREIKFRLEKEARKVSGLPLKKSK